MGGDPTARPTHATGRSAAVDLARGLAVVAMVVAHTAPVGALSCYALQVVALAVLVATVTHDGDDHWWVLVAVTVVLVGFASALRRLAGPVGPVEWVVRLPTRPLRGVS